MKYLGKYLLIAILFITGIWCYRRYQVKLTREKELKEKLAREREEMRQTLCNFFKSKLDGIRSANTEFHNYTDYKSGYFSNFQLDRWQKKYLNLYNEIRQKPFENIQLPFDEVSSIRIFKDNYTNSDALRKEFNVRFIKEELKLYSSFFDAVEGRKLDIQQRTAVVTDEDNNIVIAGAGSGKTTTIVGKVNYLINRYKVDPQEILLISFTNKSASTLAERINIDGVDAKTFHKFGKDVIAEAESKQPSIFDEAQFKPLITRFFKELIRNEKYLNKVVEYFNDYLKPPKSQFEFDNRGDYIQYIKDQNFRTYKQIPVNGKTTYRMEVVKSIEECKIANFLLFNSVNYEYELPYEHETATEFFRQYKPDFTINQKGRKVYIEHLALSKSGEVPKFFTQPGESYEDAKDRYHSKVEWARDLHNSHSTILIETFSSEMKEGSLFSNLTKQLQDKGIVLVPKSPEEIWKIINESAQDEVKSFINLFGTFINLLKSNNYSINDVILRNNRGDDIFTKKRNSIFIEIIKPIYEQYEQYLAARNEIDFSDMINIASLHISNNRIKRNFSYVIIDEFQDISIGRYQLVKAIKSNNPACKLFCVGDDWQSIYRFSGSDITLFKEFEKYFGYTVKSKIETTYRFRNPLISLSSEFIQKNPNQARKELRAVSSIMPTSYKINYSITADQDDTEALKTIFIHLLTTVKNIQKKEVFILRRYGFDIDRIKNENKIFNVDKNGGNISYTMKTAEEEIRTLKAQFMTVHKAKGLEADIIIILNCNSGKHGFPSEMSDDPILNLLLSEADQFENGEERRLFYVAMTRAKEHLFFIADSSYKSKFITELEINSGQSPNKKCPACKSSDLVLRKTGTARNGNRYNFFGCTNYLYGCDFTSMEWINQN